MLISATPKKTETGSKSGQNAATHVCRAVSLEGYLHPKGRDIGRPGISRNRNTLCAVLAGISMLCGLFATTASAQKPAEAQFIRAADVEHAIHHHGGRVTALMLSRNHEWPRVRRAVAAGWGNWEKLLPALLPYSDPSTLKSMMSALSHALPINPEATLAALPPEMESSGLRYICSPAQKKPEWRERSLIKLSNPMPLQMEARRHHCLKSLQAESEA